MKKLASRQVHLDFHTSELMPNVGERFNKENFQKALKLGELDSITIFAKCHHSWCYYPTKVGAIHPTLKFDLTGSMVEAAHEIGVRAPIYITVGWSSNDAGIHPEWLAKNKDGSVQLVNYDLNAKIDDKKPIVSWKVLCPSGDYAKHIYDITREICERYSKVDGLFYDICFINNQCYCDSCIKGMKEHGLNSEIEEDAKKYYIKMRRNFMLTCTNILHEKHPEGTIFFNGGADQYRPQYHDLQTHFELEDLPTTWGGYDKMPPRAKFFARSGKDYLGMTGKFHTMWGEFGGFKNFEALKYECAAMLTYGARCSVGDQMHPCGEMDMETYRTIGNAYEYVKKIEEYCYNVEETTRLGVVLSESEQAEEGGPVVNMSDEGLVKMLLERQMDFDIVLPEDDLSRFDTIILPDSILLNEDFAGRIKTFIANGGGVLLTGESGLNIDKSHFIIDIGAEYQAASEFENDYVRVSNELSEGLVTTPFLFYEGAQKVALKGGEVLAWIREPYFNRTYGHYCSHQNTPYKLEDAYYPAAIRKERVVYLAHNICKMYFQHGAQYHRDYFINALKLIYKEPVIKASMPSAGRVRFVKQASDNRYILHLLYGAPIQRGRTSIIEDLPPLYDISVRVKVEAQLKKLYLAHQKDEVKFTQKDGIVEFIVPKVQCHQIVVLEY